MTQSVPEAFLASGRSREELTAALRRASALRDALDKMSLAAEESAVRACQTAATAKQADEFYRKAIFLLYHFVTPPNPEVRPHLEAFREMLQERVGHEHLEIALHELKNLLERTAPEIVHPVVELEAPEGEPTCPDTDRLRHEVLERSRHIYVDLLEALRLDLDEEYTTQVGNLFERVRNCPDMETLLRLGAEVTGVVRRFSREVVDKRREAQAFATEILVNLADLNASLKATLAQNEDQGRSDAAFNASLDTQLESLHGSVTSANDLGALKERIIAGLRTVGQTVERKRREDEVRLGETQLQLATIRSEFGRLAKRVASVQRENITLARKVQLDPLTGIHNRYAFTRRLESEHARIKRYNSKASVVMADIDHFKVINDTYGHLVGDKVLVEVARRLKSTMRESDFLARYGGEEFVAILPETGLENALAAAEKMRVRIENTDFMVRGTILDITISCGVAEILADTKNAFQALDNADKALYEAKRTGRNKVRGQQPT